MNDPDEKLTELLTSDHRYSPQAYHFVFEALKHAQGKLGRSESLPREERHMTGQELCEGIRDLALQQFGLMTLTVFSSWGITGTSDFGQIVFNLIRSGHMKKNERDCLDDFNDVYDFEETFRKGFRIECEQPPE